MGVREAKAGALTIALDETDRRATHVAVVDADYQARPEFLAIAARFLDATGADAVQFPQAYRSGRRTQAVTLELESYFASAAAAGDAVEAALPTGTLSVIGIEALRAVGGWSGRTLTEDADLGQRLAGAAFAVDSSTPAWAPACCRRVFRRSDGNGGAGFTATPARSGSGSRARRATVPFGRAWSCASSPPG